MNRIAARDPAPSSDFLAECGIDAEDRTAIQALSVRTILSNYAGIAPEILRPSDRFDVELSHLSFTENFDIIRFSDDFHALTGVRITDKALEKITHPDLSPKGMTLLAFTLEVIESAPSIKSS